ncbi:MAG: DUF2189 domain-containing protein [Betaproteobacteria bacterium]|nr:DUF2189 domain-containing protein [Betaproteobacteria bacterium]
MSARTFPAARSVSVGRPLAWLALGWQDFLASGFPSFVHGLIVTFGGLMIIAMTMLFWPLMPGAISGFVLVGPILATGLYELSRQRAAGRATDITDVLVAWRRGTRPLVQLGVLLLVAATAWVVVSALLFGHFVHVRIDGPVAFLRYAAVSQGNAMFFLWLLLGGLGSAVIFASTAVAPPLLLERSIDLRAALLASVRAVGDNPVPMALWAAIIMGATALSLVTFLLGFIIVIPVIGHATWHAYRDLVDADAWPLRAH